MSTFRAGVFSFLALSSAFTICIGLYVARPWSDNYAFQNANAYLALAGLLLFGVTPQAGLFLLSKIFPPGSRAATLFLIGAFAITACGGYAYFDTVFIHPDAQGGLALIFLPIYQWLAAIVVTIICLAVLRMSSMRSHAAQLRAADDARGRSRLSADVGQKRR